MKKKLHVIGNAHLDPVWLWNWQEGYQENLATFKSAVDRLREYDDVVFTSSSAQFYVWLEECNKKLFNEIKQYIVEGRWVICGGWWVQPDCNIPSGESFARHTLLSQNYFFEKFGKIAKTGFCVDSFGHNGMLPQILQKSRMENYVFMRPGDHEKKLPSRIFIWESIDGSRVTAFRLPYSYATFGNVAEHVERCTKVFDPEIPYMMCFYGVGNHGGGPTIENIETVKKEAAKYPDIDFEFSDPDTFFAEVKKVPDWQKKLPVICEDLQHHAPGCYTAVSDIKNLNRKAEHALLCAEKFASLSSYLGKAGYVYAASLDKAWKNVLFNQFHDILAGSSIESAYDDARNDLGEAISIAQHAQNLGVQAMTFAIDIPHDENTLPFVALNPHSWKITASLEFEADFFSDRNGKKTAEQNGFILADASGAEIPYQFIDSVSKTRRKRIAFTVSLPAFGYKLLKILRNRQPKVAPQPAILPADSAESLILENTEIRVVFDKTAGGINQITDKQTGTNFLSSAVSVPVMEDRSDTWSHDIPNYTKKIGAFEVVSIKKTESGAVRDVIEVTSRFGNSLLVQSCILYKNSRSVIVRARINCQEQLKCIKFSFPVNSQAETAIYEMPFGYIRKKNDGMEEPMQSYVSLEGKGYGLSIINTGKSGVDINKNTINITALRTPVYAHHDPYVLRDDEHYRYVDQGIREFTYVLYPYRGSFTESETIQKSLELNQPCFTACETFHKGDLPPEAGFMQIDARNVVLSALKKAQSSDEYIIRVYETGGKATKTTITIFGVQIAAALGAHEIKTYAFRINGVAREVDLLEWDVGDYEQA